MLIWGAEEVACGDGLHLPQGRLRTAGTWLAHSGSYCLERSLDVAEVCTPAPSTQTRSFIGTLKGGQGRSGDATPL